MKKSTFWKLGLTAALLFGLSACSDTTSSDNEFGDESSQKTTSSSSKSDKDGKSSGKEASSSSVATAKDSVYCDSLEKLTLAAPTDLNVVKNSDSTWILLWNYTANDSRPENGFLIETLNMTDSIPSWKKMDSTAAAVTMYNLVGKKKAGKYYRVSAKDQCLDKATKKFVAKYSKPTSMVQVSTTGSGSTSISEGLSIPTDLKLDTLGDNQWLLSWSYSDNASRPENGFKLQSLNPNDSIPNWKDAGTTQKGVRVFKIDGKKKGGWLYQVAAKDANGISEYSSQILIPTAPDPNDAAANTEEALAVPTDVKIDSMGGNKWKLSWSYAENTDNGFKLEYLDLTAAAPTWASTAADTTAKNVRYIIIDATKHGGQYVHVAAKGKDSKVSKFSSDIMIPQQVGGNVVDETIVMAVPTSLKLDSIGQNKWRLSWSFVDNSKRPENGFILQTLNLENGTGWSNMLKGTTAQGVHHFIIDNTAKTFDNVFVRVGAKDAAGKTDDYSEEILIPSYVDYSTQNEKKTMVAPTSLKLDTLGFGQYQLSWDYDDYADNGFILQSMDPKTTGSSWTYDPTKDVPKGVHLIILDGAGSDGGLLFRVAALGGTSKSDTSLYSSAIAIPYVSADGTVDNGTITTALSVPSKLDVIDMGNNNYKITWEYKNASGRTAEGFDIEKLDPNASQPSWGEEGETNKGVYFYTVKATTKEMAYRVSARDNKGNSEWSESVVVPAAYTVPPKKGCIGEFAAPIAFAAERVAPSAWRLIWNYNRNTECVEEGFVIQKLDVTGGPTGTTEKVWVDLDSTDVNVLYYNLEGIANLNQYYRVAAKRGSHRTEFSSDVQITRLIAYSADVPFKAPQAKARVYQSFYAFNYYDYTNNKVVANRFTNWPKRCTDAEIAAEPENCKEKDIFEFQTVVVDSFPNHAIVYKNTKKLEYQFRWDGETEDMWRTVTITDDAPDGYSTTATVIPYDLCQSYSQVRTIWEDNEAIDTTEWSKPVGPVYNSFEYLKLDNDEENCDDLYDQNSDDPEEVAKYKKCKNKPKPYEGTPCKAG